MTKASFKDHFSTQAATYASSRPQYPDALFAWLAESSPGRGQVWDAGCGNGQAARGLARHFASVYASDPSAAQIAAAKGPGNLLFVVEPAEHCGLPDASCDLATVAQAAHWFDLPAYYREVARVLRPGGLLAIWGYGLHSVSDPVDGLMRRLYDDILGPYWPPERRLIEGGYADLPFPWPRLAAPQFEISLTWTLPHYLAYLLSWSATQRYIADQGHDPVSAMTAEFAAAWGNADCTVSWPIHLLAGRAPG